MIVTRISRNIHHFEDEIKVGEGWPLLLISDLHLDNPKCRRDLLIRDLNEAKKRNAKVMINGDFFCIMQGKYDNRSSKKDIRPEHLGANYFQLVRDEAIEFMRPYAQNILLIGYGNHETAVLKRHEFDLLADFVTLFNERTGANVQLGGYGGWCIFNLLRQGGNSGAVFKLRYHHGHGGGGEVTKGVIQDQRMMARTEGADATWQGHVHELYAHITMSERIVVTSRGGWRVDLKPVHQIRTATYKEEFSEGFGGFHVERGAPPKPLGGIWMTLRLVRKHDEGKDVIFVTAECTKTDTMYHL